MDDLGFLELDMIEDSSDEELEMPTDQHFMKPVNKDIGQFHGTTRVIDGHEVPTGYGYMVLPYYRSKEGHTVQRKH